MPGYCSTDIKLRVLFSGIKNSDLLNVFAIHELNHTILPMSLNVVKIWDFTNSPLKQ